ncbi:MAG: DNA-binding response regulator [Bacteroidetes bacterium]|nr:MAG: DNA-binding response regulator [Bacteroidota bacterium]
MFKAAVIDDEANARKNLITIINNYCDDINIVGQAENVKSGQKLILNKKPDIVFLDIEMPDGTGFDLLEKIPKRNFSLIFTTGHNDFALKAFQFNAVDYILKPVDIEDVINAVNKAKQIQKPELSEKIIKQLLISVKEKTNKKIILKTAETVFIVKVEEIIRCESDRGYTTFFIKDGKKIVISKNLKEYELLLKDFNFFRTHNSHLVNLNYVKQFQKTDGGQLIMKDNSKIPVSVRKKEAVLYKLENLL